MVTNIMKRSLALFLWLLAGLPAAAGTLYRWTDASGEVRYGYQPPPGVEVQTAATEWREQHAGTAQPACPDLAQEHLRKIDRELARVQALPAGLGPEYEFTPAARQELVLDLLAHRAALVTGRRAEEFRAPTMAQLREMKDRFEKQKRGMEAALRQQGEAIEAQTRRLARKHKDASYARRVLQDLPSATIPDPAGR